MADDSIAKVLSGETQFESTESKKASLYEYVNDVTSYEKEAQEDLASYELSLWENAAREKFEIEQEYAKKKKKQEVDVVSEAAKEAARLNNQAKAIEDKLNDKRLSERKKKKLKKQKEEILALANDKDKLEAEAKKKADAKAKKEEKDKKLKARQANNKSGGKSINNLGQTFKNLASYEDENGNKKTSGTALLANTLNLIGSMTAQLNGTIEDIAKNQGAIDTRLNGSNHATKSGSIWRDISTNIAAATGASPLVSQKKVVENLNTLVGKGISYNVEQRAFLMTIKDKIATTFNAADSSLLRLVRIQQQDTTAGRLGMEAALNEFLNNMYETTEYLEGVATSVRSNLLEAQSLMDAQAATALEYQVQKWMGSLYSVGMSETAVQGIAGAFGKLAAGDISGLTDGGYGNLMVMAANESGLSISDMLASGLDDSETNKLMQSMVNYLGKLYDNAKDSKVIQQQLASVYGVKASDLKAATNLTSYEGTMDAIYGKKMSYGSMLRNLNSMANSMSKRTSVGEMMTNAWDNFQYTLAGNIANNPAMYGIFKVAGMLDDLVGGIDFSLPTVLGTGMSAQTFNVADIMRTGTFAASLISGLGTLIGGTANGMSGGGILKAIGINNNITTVNRGSGNTKITSGSTTSEMGTVVGQSESDAAITQTQTGTKDDAATATANAADDSNETKLKDVDTKVAMMLELFRSWDAIGSMKVTIAGVQTTEALPVKYSMF